MSDRRDAQHGVGTEQSHDRTVWVVTGNYADDPHPHVLGVYDNEDAAKEHEKAIRDSIKPSEPVAWGRTEVEVNSEPLRERRSRVDV